MRVDVCTVLKAIDKKGIPGKFSDKTGKADQTNCSQQQRQ
jgi:hypothetical protein